MIIIKINETEIRVPAGALVAVRSDDRLLFEITEDGSAEPGKTMESDELWINRKSLPALCGLPNCPFRTLTP